MFLVGNVKYNNFPYFETKYDDMAQKGWELKKIWFNLIHVFKRSEPINRKYKFELFDIMSTPQKYTDEEVAEYHELNKSQGWNFVTNIKNLELYYTDDENAVSIYTDAESERKLQVKLVINELKSLLVAYIIFLIYLVVMFIKGDMKFLGVDGFNMPSILFSLWYFILVLEGFADLRFYYRNKKAWEDSYVPVKYNSGLIGVVSGWVWILILILAAVYLITYWTQLTSLHGMS
ncbi:MAG: DUF2812 domain-containing protein [Clostridiaceae bacterium]